MQDKSQISGLLGFQDFRNKVISEASMNKHQHFQYQIDRLCELVVSQIGLEAFRASVPMDFVEAVWEDYTDHKPDDRLFSEYVGVRLAVGSWVARLNVI